jgi:hypothetical protein
MRDLGLIIVAVVVAAVVVERALRRRAPRQAEFALVLSGVLVRLLVGAIFALIAARALEDPDALWIGVAVFFGLLALGSVLVAVLLVVGFAQERREGATSGSSAAQ